MDAIYKKIENKIVPEFTMPLSLRLIKEFEDKNINVYKLHLADLLSVTYAIRIENAKRYLEEMKRKRMNDRGISSIEKASVSDFDNL